MYPPIHPKLNLRKPSQLSEARAALRRVRGYEERLSHIPPREIHILIPQRSVMSWSCLESNERKGFPTYADPLHPQNHLAKETLRAVRYLGKQKDSYVCVLSHYLTPLILDPNFPEPTVVEELREFYRRHRVYGIRRHQRLRAYEHDLKYYKWFSERGFERLKEPELDEEMESRKWAGERKEIIGDLAEYLLYQGSDQEIKVFTYVTGGRNYSHDRRIMERAIEDAMRRGAKIRKYPAEGFKDFVDSGDRLSLNSLTSVNRFRGYLARQLGQKPPERREVKKGGQPFYYPSAACPESKTICPFYHPRDDKCLYAEPKQRALESFERKTICDEQRVPELARKYGIPFDDVPYVLPIEVASLGIMMVHGFVEPFGIETREVKQFDVRASDMNASCVLDILFSRTGLKPETERMKLGDLIHEIALKDPEGVDYINHKIYQLDLWNIAPRGRSEFCERSTFTTFGDIVAECTPDGSLLWSDKIILVNYKLGRPMRYAYRIKLINQLAFEALVLENLGYDVADFCYFAHMEGPEGPLLRRGYLTPKRKIETMKKVQAIYDSKTRIEKNPVKVHEEFERQLKTGNCEFCFSREFCPSNLYKLEEALYSL